MFTQLISLLAVLAIPGVHAWSSDNHTCALQQRYYSCEVPSSVLVDTCCSPTQGLVLTTQFWSIYTGLESKGQLLPPNSWSIHGLWPDRCNGSYGQYCDLDRQYDPYPSPNTTTGTPSGTVVPKWLGGDIITPLLNRFGKYDLLNYMNSFWINQGDYNWVFWQHEFSKHATCFSTYDVGNNGSPDCYGPDYVNSTEASIVQFLEKVVEAQVQYPTFDWLKNASIVPSNTTTYNVSALESVLASKSGAIPYLGCSADAKGNRTVLSEVWYYSHELGAKSGIFKPVNQTGNSSCVRSLPLHYYLRANGSEWKQY